MSPVETQYWDLCREADELLNTTRNVGPTLARALDLVRAHPDHRELFIRCFVKTLKGRGPWEVVQYCMYYLKWPEVHDAAAQLKQRDPRDAFAVKPVLEVYEPSFDPEFLTA